MILKITQFVLFTKYCNTDQIKEYGMGGACNIHAKNTKFIQNFSRKTWREGTTWGTYG